MENNPEDVHDLWNEPDYAEVKRMLCDHLLAELIDGERGYHGELGAARPGRYTARRAADGGAARCAGSTEPTGRR